MSSRFLALLGGVVLVIALLIWWSRPASLADQISVQSVRPEQTRLWKEVARRGTPASLERLRTPDRLVQPRRPPQASEQVAPGRGSLAPGVVNGIRVISRPVSSEPTLITGQGTVKTVLDDRVVLDLGANRELVLVARFGGKPLAVAPGQNVAIDFKVRPSLFDAQEILAVRTQTGTELITAAESGAKPVTLTVTLPAVMTLSATQVGTPDKGAMNVNVVIQEGVKGETKNAKELMPGQTAQIGSRWVRILGSIAQPGSAGAIDGSPYAIELVAWR